MKIQTPYSAECLTRVSIELNAIKAAVVWQSSFDFSRDCLPSHFLKMWTKPAEQRLSARGTFTGARLTCITCDQLSSRCSNLKFTFTQRL